MSWLFNWEQQTDRKINHEKHNGSSFFNAKCMKPLPCSIHQANPYESWMINLLLPFKLLKE